MFDLIKRFGKAAAGRKLACFAAAFSVILFCLCGSLRDLKLALCLSGAASVVFVVLFAVISRPKQGIVTVILAWTAATALFYFNIYGVYSDALKLAGQKGEFRIEITSYPRAASQSTIYEGLLSGEGHKQKVTLIVYDIADDLCSGDNIIVNGKITMQSDEYFTSSAAEKEFLTVRASAGKINLDTSERPIKYYPKYFSHKIQSIIDAYLEGDQAALLKALLTGSKSEMSTRLKNALSLSGTSHITAVSGMHIGFIAAAGVYLLGRKHGMIAALPVMLFFGMSTGMNPPVLRALLMAAIALGAFAFDRESDGATTLSAALVLILAFDPTAILSVSLQLSFAAVAGIMLFYSPILRTLNAFLPIRLAENKAVRGILMSLAASLSATMGSFPISAIYFDRISVISPLSNLAVLWMVPVIMASGVILVFAALIFPPAAALLTFIPAYASKGFISLIYLFAGIHLSSVSLGNYPALAVMAVCYGLLAFGYLVRPKLRVGTVVLTLASILMLFAAHVVHERTVTDIEVYDSGLTMIYYSGKAAAFLPRNGEQRNYIEKDSLNSLYLRGRMEADNIFDQAAEEESPNIDGVYIVRDNGAISYIADLGGHKTAWLCGGRRGLAFADMPDELRRVDVLVLDRDFAGDYYQMRRLNECISAENIVVCGGDGSNIHAFDKLFSGAEINYIAKGSSKTFELK